MAFGGPHCGSATTIALIRNGVQVKDQAGQTKKHISGEIRLQRD